MPRTAIVMSRLPRLIDPQSTWLKALRAALRRLESSGDSLVMVEGTAGCDFIRRGAQRLGVPIEVLCADEPVRDQVLIRAADTVIALSVRTNGNIHRALRQRLVDGRTVELADLPSLQSPLVRDDLIELGASPWVPPADQIFFAPEVIFEVHEQSVYEVVPFPTGGDWVYLSHTTRSCPGPWPGETIEQYVDSLLDGLPTADHSAVAALERIVTQGRLLASSRTIRGGSPVVCWTAVPLADLPNLRQFRTHRARWDFEPYGLCIHGSWLEKHGVRPVIYGDEETWQQMPVEDRPFFQLTRQPESEPSQIDWSIEQEWRHLGDLHLQDLPRHQAFVFVPTAEAAARLFRSSPWPITLWPDPASAIVEID